MEKTVISEEIFRIVPYICDTTLAYEASILPEPEPLSPYRTTEIIIDGAWQGKIITLFDKSACEVASQKMYAKEETSEDEIADVVRELTNMIAGNIKTVLPEPCTLSTPHSIEEQSQDKPDGLLLEVPFKLGDGKLSILVIKESLRNES